MPEPRAKKLVLYCFIEAGRHGTRSGNPQLRKHAAVRNYAEQRQREGATEAANASLLDKGSIL